MTTTLPTTHLPSAREETAKVEVSDAAAAAQACLAGAVAFMAEKMHLNRTMATIALKQNDRSAFGYFRYGLACQVAEHIAIMDEQVRAVYMYDDEATPEDEVFGEAQPTPLVHLIIVVQRKTEALNAMLDGLDRALVHGFAGLANVPHLANVLDTQVVLDKEVKGHIGYGALVTSLHHRPLAILQR